MDHFETNSSLASKTSLPRLEDEVAHQSVQGSLIMALRHDPYDVRGAVRRCINERKARNHFLPGHLFADPAWDILLALYEAQLRQVRIGTSSLGDIAAVPATTALRWITTLVNENLVERHVDPLDARRIFVKLSANGLARMRAYFDITARSTNTEG